MHDIIQIAGIIDQAEADLLVEEGVAWLGFPLRLPVHREDLPEDEAARIIRCLRPPTRGVLITYLSRADEILALCELLGTRTVQLHGDLPPAEARRLKAVAPDLFLIKSLVVRGPNTGALENTVRELESFADAFITDTYDPSTGASGATGKIHDWSISRRLMALCPRPFILAGGLNPGNVQQAIREVGPAGVDAHTGVEGTDGRKDRNLVRRFVEQARAGFATSRRT